MVFDIFKVIVHHFFPNQSLSFMRLHFALLSSRRRVSPSFCLIQWKHEDVTVSFQHAHMNVHSGLIHLQILLFIYLLFYSNQQCCGHHTGSDTHRVVFTDHTPPAEGASRMAGGSESDPTSGCSTSCFFRFRSPVPPSSGFCSPW